MTDKVRVEDLEFAFKALGYTVVTVDYKEAADELFSAVAETLEPKSTNVINNRERLATVYFEFAEASNALHNRRTAKST